MRTHACVIGSGPSGVACASALLKTGAQVTILDVGFTADAESQSLLAQYRREGNVQNLLRNIHHLRQQHHQHSSIQPGKSVFGSDYPYKTLDETSIKSSRDAVVRSSLGRGGLSAVWGATVSTAVPDDISDWPISFDDLIPFYQSLDDLMSVSSPAAEMREIFPLKIGQEPTFELGPQGGELLTSLKRHRSDLLRDGMHVGRAKLAVGPKHSLDQRGCTPCGLCMHGCPNQAIFNAAYELKNLIAKDALLYRPGTLVQRFEETQGRVRVQVKNLADGSQTWLSFDRLFIACGVINSTAIVARSLNMTDHEFRIKDSQKFIFPLLRWKRSKGAILQKQNTLAQVYLIVDNPEVSRNIVQIQYYGYNDLLLDPLRRRFGQAIASVVTKAVPSLLERIMISFVYLHSNESGRLSLRVTDQSKSGVFMGEISGSMNPRSEEVVRSLIRLITRHREAHGGVPLRPALRATPPGDSQHIGSTFPMSRNPGPYETDTLGRPQSCDFVHVVDSSVLPSIPGTPIVFTVMANAFRIATEAIKGSEK